MTEPMRRLMALALLTPLAGLAKPSVDMGAYIEPKEPAVKAALETFCDRKLGMMVHFGLYSQTGIVESWPLSDEDADWSRREVERDLSSDEGKSWTKKLQEPLLDTLLGYTDKLPEGSVPKTGIAYRPRTSRGTRSRFQPIRRGSASSSAGVRPRRR